MYVLWYFCYYTIPLRLDHKHTQIPIFNKISPLSIHNLKCNAPIAPELVLFLHGHLDVDVLAQFDADLLGGDQGAGFSYTSCEGEEALDYRYYYLIFITEGLLNNLIRIGFIGVASRNFYFYLAW